MTEVSERALVAFYLPQYHPIPENDLWWGPGFTDWNNVVKARPQFPGHYQPHIPADLGFYDPRLAQVREQQAALANDAGISAFAYYHYWFHGHRLLERPLDEVIRTKRPDFPFLLVWANENWTRRWDGQDREVLIDQKYSLEDDRAHIRALRHLLCDERYLCRDHKPILAVYRAGLLPDPRATTDIWRHEAQCWGLPDLYLLRVESRFTHETGDPRPLGFDAAVQFQPKCTLPHSLPLFILRRRFRWLSPRYSHHVYHYRDLAHYVMNAPLPSYPRWPGVTPGSDNSPRRRREATIFVGQSPRLYQDWLTQALRQSQEVAHRFESRPRGGLVFINAWNEWAEGSHLEPDQRFGHAFLDATKAALALAGSPPPQRDVPATSAAIAPGTILG